METPSIMGIINCTPDSFYEGSRKKGISAIGQQALHMIEEGADILDIGGESSRPGASYVSAQEEIDRVLPVIEFIRKESSIALSLDTRKSDVAREAVKFGIQYINDISALQDDPVLATVAADNGCKLILMHKKGLPENMQMDPEYKDLLKEVYETLMVAVKVAQEKGLDKNNIILDPGIGFGKTSEHNRKLLQSITKMKEWGFPILIGLSRKSYIGGILNAPVEERLYGTLAADIYAIMQGASVIRVHDVKPHRDALMVLKDLLWNG